MLPDARLAMTALALMAGPLCALAGEPAVDNTGLVIGLLVPPEEPAAASLRDGATFAAAQANLSPGPHVRLVIRGRSGQWGADGVEAARMVTDDGALGLIAPPDGAASHLVLQVSGRTAVPVISLCTDSSVTRTGVPWMARIVPSTAEEARTLFAGIRAGHWIAVVPAGRAGREAARDLKEAATNRGCALAQMIEADPSSPTPARLAKQILAERPDAVLLWLDPAAAGTLAGALRAAGFTGTLAGPGRLRSAEFAAAAGGGMEGLKVSAPVLDMDSAAAFQIFSNDFHKHFGHEPDATAAAACDAMRLLIHLLGQTDGRPAHESFPIHSSFTGVTGVLTFDSEGNRQATLQLLEARGGSFVPVKTGPDE